MKIIKQNDDFGPKISLKEEDKQVVLMFGGNGDLYWVFNSSNVTEDNEFTITKENYELYQLFDRLFYDIENVNIFAEEKNLDNIEDISEYLKLKQEEKEYEKKKYKQFNNSNYNELYNEEEKQITWYSDETNHKVSNILKIKKENELFKLEFYIQPYVDGYDRDFNSFNSIPIRFRNSGSSYDPFNIIFMRMYNDMKEIRDIDDIGHQMHIEEYIWNKNKTKKITAIRHI